MIGLRLRSGTRRSLGISNKSLSRYINSRIHNIERLSEYMQRVLGVADLKILVHTRPMHAFLGRPGAKLHFENVSGLQSGSGA